MAYGLGIDVGTTFTGAALAYETHTEMLPLSDTALVAPSVVVAARDGRLLTGDAAVRGAEAEPGRAVHEFKRRLGDPTPIILGDRRYSPTELIAAVVRDVLQRAREVTGDDPGAVVLTCPAIWGPYRLEQFAEVPALSGLEECRVVTEPEAAAAFYLSGRSLAPHNLVAVYDLGGGTFDTAIVRASSDGIELIGSAEGVDGAGGADLDQVVLAMVDEQLRGAVSRLARAQPAQAAVLARLRADATRAKEALSSEPVVVMPFFLADGPHEVELTRAEFERRIGPIIDPTIEAIWRALTSVGVDPPALDAILLSGGSSRVPHVTRRLEEEFARPVRTFGHPKHVVALGAATLAREDLRLHTLGGAVDADAGELTKRIGAGWLPRPLRAGAAILLTLLVLAGILLGADWLGRGPSGVGPNTPLGADPSGAGPSASDAPSSPTATTSKPTPTTTTASPAFVPVAIEAESGTLEGAASAISCASCSGGYRVGNIADTSAVVLRANISESGKRTVRVTYASDGLRQLRIQLNGVNAVTTWTTGTGWENPLTFEFAAQIPAGTVELRFYNDALPAPDIDRVTIS